MKFNFKKLQVKLSEKSYPIYIGANTLGNRDLWWKEYAGQKIFIVADTNTSLLYAPLLQTMFGDQAQVF